MLEKKPEDEQPAWDGKDFKQYKPALTGKEIDLGETPFNLAQYATQNNSKELSVSEKLYINNDNDMYIEIAVKSHPLDVQQAPEPVPVPEPPVAPKVQRGNRNEPVTQEDHEWVEEFKKRETAFKGKIAELKKLREEVTQQNMEVQQEYQKLQMQDNDLERVER